MGCGSLVNSGILSFERLIFFGEVHRRRMSVPTTVGGLIRRLSGSRQLSAASSDSDRVADNWRRAHPPPVGQNPFVGWLAGWYLGQNFTDVGLKPDVKDKPYSLKIVFQAVLFIFRAGFKPSPRFQPSFIPPLSKTINPCLI